MTPTILCAMNVCKGFDYDLNKIQMFGDFNFVDVNIFQILNKDVSHIL